MAGAKLSSRQKMIGMMYLVLTAMLALNVSKEILDAFVTVNNGLENTGHSFDKDISSLYAKFDEKKSIDPLRVQTMWAKAQEAKKLSKDIGDYIDQMKKMLLRETEGYKHKEEDTIHLDFVDGKERYDIPTNILCGQSEEGTDGQAHVLRGKLEAYKNSLLNLLPPAEKAAMHLSIESKDPTDGGEFHTWEMKTFYHTPLAADVTILSKIQDDVKGAEADVVEALLRQTDSDIIPFDTVAARVISPTNYVMMGDTFKADIFLAAFNKTLKPQILLGKFNPLTGKMEGAYDSVPVNNGMGKYFVDANKEGIFTYEGVINMTTPKGKVMQYPFQSEYIVARPALTVSADKMNVMYAGLDNPITVSVPGFAAEKTHVHVNNGVMKPLGNGKYVISGLKAAMKPTTCDVSVTVTTDKGEERSMGTMQFRVKNLPTPIVYPSGVTTMRTSAASLYGCPGLVCKYGDDFNFEARAYVIDYSLDISDKSGQKFSSEGIKGFTLPPAAKTVLKNPMRGTKVTFYDVHAKGADGVLLHCPDMVYIIK
ncbi:MAG TPA: gliding motility protein GldM [Bacteroidia bacterium]|nr:gliding motility protein GldM [Bacteroidia bacterium]